MEKTRFTEHIRVYGLVQGVGFRPTVWRVAHDCGITGEVRNDGAGVLIMAQAATLAALEQFCAQLITECPPLARIERIERTAQSTVLIAAEFVIASSASTAIRTSIVPDAAPCAACLADIRTAANRRYRYAFTNCTHCGPRLSIVHRLPYDRANTSMAAFALCPHCAAEYANPADRRFHAQPIACANCGPRVWLVDRAGQVLDPADDPMQSASRLLAAGQIVAIKGVGGFQLACAATNDAAVAELRRRKRRPEKPLALMARDLAVIGRYCQLNAEECAALTSSAAPILLLQLRPDAAPLAAALAPEQTTLGMMLPSSPLHHLLLADWAQPLVMTSGNLNDEPPCLRNAEALNRLVTVADALLLHDREIVHRADDSLLRVVAGAPRLLRRARGFAPAPLPLPAGFADAPAVLAFGSELKNTFCLTRDGQAILSPHLGDLGDAGTARAYRQQITEMLALVQHQPEVLAIDLHPDYHASHFGREWASNAELPLINVQHHHAHLAAVLADHGRPRTAGAVLGILLDGLGYGTDGTLWGGEFLIGDYQSYQRVAHLKPVALPGGVQAIREPWRHLYAQLVSAGLWETLRARHPQLPIVRGLLAQPLDLLTQMLARGINAPRTSSAGRLCDAVAAALGAGNERVNYEGQAAIALETLATNALSTAGAGYLLAQVTTPSAIQLDPAPLWTALLNDLAHGVAREHIAARFHIGFSNSIIALSCDLTAQHHLDTVALSGGVWQNRILLETVSTALMKTGLQVLLHRQIPANDGGLSLGQACIAAAQFT
ncbi:carbamoyltransferase HypF [Chromatium okenii]|uniref:Carbamoyltransferase HypF n=1 Tax=Chromatium okenii TaxID=61644 RepID=A0A2S7XRU3_9GAMM|nr:carbamoyltransferase HypF [Chromatium okenii]PQJ96366.1 carbamoyltransferase HypF [Chromatium okenii]